MNTSLINKVLERHQLHQSLDILSEKLNTSELTTFLSHVFASRIAHVKPGSLRQAITQDRFVLPSTVSPRVFHKFDAVAFDTLPENFELMELSPLAPLGSVSALAPVDDSLVVHTSRCHDVVSDCTNVIALHAASLRDKISPRERPPMHFCASQRMVRTQLPQNAQQTAHFKILTLVSCGRDTGSHTFEVRSLMEHIGYYISLIRKFPTTNHASIEVVLKEFTDTGIDWNAIENTLQELMVTTSHQRLERDNWNYYSPFQFNINLRIGDELFNLADGGIVDWTQKLLSDQKERLMISGFGTERFCKLFLLP